MIQSDISIVMATYNGEKYISEQLESIKKQSLQPFEVIVQDDCSTDRTLEIVQSFSTTLPLKIYKNESNLGFVKNFESALKKATCGYIALCDQDDIWEYDKLEKLYSNIGENSLIYSNSILIDSNGSSLNKRLSQKLKNNFIDSKNGLNFIFDNCVSAHAILFKRGLLEFLFPFPKFIYFDAYIAATASSLNGVVYWNESLVRYRQHDTNTLSRTKKQKLSFVQKIQQKIHKKTINNTELLNIVQDVKNIKTLTLAQKKLIQKLESFLLEFENRWFSFEMCLFLYHNRSIFFPITTKNIFLLSVKKSIGYKLYKVAPFL